MAILICLLVLVSKKLCDLGKGQQNLRQNTNFDCSVDSSLQNATKPWRDLSHLSQGLRNFCFMEKLCSVLKILKFLYF